MLRDEDFEDRDECENWKPGREEIKEQSSPRYNLFDQSLCNYLHVGKTMKKSEVSSSYPLITLDYLYPPKILMEFKVFNCHII